MPPPGRASPLVQGEMTRVLSTWTGQSEERATTGLSKVWHRLDSAMASLVVGVSGISGKNKRREESALSAHRDSNVGYVWQRKPGRRFRELPRTSSGVIANAEGLYDLRA